MALPEEMIWDAEPHTLAKHEILRKYLQGWMPIISTRFPRMIYFDGFSGPGVYKGGEPGSPVVAVQVAKEIATVLKQPFPKIEMLFSEERTDRKQELDTQIEKSGVPPYCSVSTLNSSFEAAAERLLLTYTMQDQPPTFTLIDPFGFSGIPFSVIGSLMRRRSSECLITFMVESINRWLEHPNEDVRRHIIEAFGTEEVLSIVDGHAINRVPALRELYLDQLRKLGKYCRYFEMRNRDNRVLYYLFFVSNNALGFLKMKEAMWAVDQTGCFRYSDATSPDQEILFAVEHTWLPVLVKQIEEKFRGIKKVRIEDINTFVRENTMFLDKHTRAAMRKLESELRIKPHPKKTNGEQRRKNSFPDGVIVDFQ